jgi:hypothetical protein
MRNNSDIEKLLSEMPGPCVASGSHRTRLWEELKHSKFEEQPRMVTVTWKRVAVFCCVMAALAGSSWAAYQVCHKSFIVEYTEHVCPDGTVVTVPNASIGSDDPNFTQEDADREHAMTKRAIAAGNYTFVKAQEFECAPGKKQTAYCYKVKLEDGRTIGLASAQPLPEPEDE